MLHGGVSCRSGRAEDSSRVEFKKVPGSRSCFEATRNDERRGGKMKSNSGLTLIGIIVAIVVMGLLGAGVMMLVSTGSRESIQTLNWGQAFFAAESGVSAARAYMGTTVRWFTNTPHTITGMMDKAAFSVVITSNGQVTSVGRWAEAQWTSIWQGNIDPVLWYTNGLWEHNLVSFPGNNGDCAQSFKTKKKITVTRIEIQGRKDSMNCSDIYMTIREGSTVGPVLGTSEIVLSEYLPKPENAWYPFTFGMPVVLAANATYYMRLESVPASTVKKGKAKGRFWWTCNDPKESVPSYPDGDAWGYIGADSDPSDTGKLQVNRDFNFRIYE